jgi:hypothetical protein
MRASLLLGSVCTAIVVVAAAPCAEATYSERELVAGIDDLCKCTGLQRKSGLLSRVGDSATVLLSADGVSEKYWIGFVDGHPGTFGPDHYKPHWGQSLVQNRAQRELCLRVIQRLDQCQYSWSHFGKPEVKMDAPRGFRVGYLSTQEKVSFSTSGYIFFLVTPKGTVCSIWYGEHY